MSSVLVVTEKPSVAKSIAKVIGADKSCEGYLEGNGYLVSWCLGHLVGLAEPKFYDAKYEKWNRADLPILPEKWEWRIAKDKKKQFDLLKKLMRRDDVESLVEATDAGREGELIFRLVYYKAGCRKPFKRLWISSMEDTAICKGFRELEDSTKYDNLYEAAVARSEADWLVGMNASRLFTTLYNARLTVGRVQTPTLAMIVDRNKEIEAFTKTKYWNVHLMKDGLDLVREKVMAEEEAKGIKTQCSGKDAVVTKAQTTTKVVNPPLLYDLTTLQRECNRQFGYTAAKTLKTAQTLYEKKLITYPRTDSRYLTEDMGGTALDMLYRVCKVFGYTADQEKDLNRVMDNSKVSDHHALLPTAEIENIDMESLSDMERNVLHLIAVQLLCATAPRELVADTQIEAECEGYTFKAGNKKTVVAGWTTYRDALNEHLHGEQEEKKNTFPEVQEGQVLTHVTTRLTEHFTAPPKPYTEDTLLSAMENAGKQDFAEEIERKGLGTPATRADIIEKLFANGYVKRKGKALIPTEEGIHLIAVLPEEVKSPKLTSDWENKLLQVEKGKEEQSEFMNEIERMVTNMTETHESIDEEEKNRFEKNREEIGKCPRCGSPVYEEKLNFRCSNKECGFRFWKESKWLTGMKKSVNAEMAKKILADGKVHVKGFVSKKTGKPFDADLRLEDTGEYVGYRLEFPDRKKE